MFGKTPKRNATKHRQHNARRAAIAQPIPSNVDASIAYSLAQIDYSQNSITIKVSRDKIQSDLLGFPLMINLSTSSGLLSSDVSNIFTEIGDRYKKIKILDKNYKQCYIEVESWDVSAQKAILHTKVDLSYTSDNYFTLYS